jgi:hypothetical protein
MVLRLTFDSVFLTFMVLMPLDNTQIHELLDWLETQSADLFYNNVPEDKWLEALLLQVESIKEETERYLIIRSCLNDNLSSVLSVDLPANAKLLLTEAWVLHACQTDQEKILFWMTLFDRNLSNFDHAILLAALDMSIWCNEKVKMIAYLRWLVEVKQVDLQCIYATGILQAFQSAEDASDIEPIAHVVKSIPSLSALKLDDSFDDVSLVLPDNISPSVSCAIPEQFVHCFGAEGIPCILMHFSLENHQKLKQSLIKMISTELEWLMPALKKAFKLLMVTDRQVLWKRMSFTLVTVVNELASSGLPEALLLWVDDYSHYFHQLKPRDIPIFLNKFNLRQLSIKAITRLFKLSDHLFEGNLVDKEKLDGFEESCLRKLNAYLISNRGRADLSELTDHFLICPRQSARILRMLDEDLNDLLDGLRTLLFDKQDMTLQIIIEAQKPWKKSLFLAQCLMGMLGKRKRTHYPLDMDAWFTELLCVLSQVHAVETPLFQKQFNQMIELYETQSGCRYQLFLKTLLRSKNQALLRFIVGQLNNLGIKAYMLAPMEGEYSLMDHALSSSNTVLLEMIGDDLLKGDGLVTNQSLLDCLSSRNEIGHCLAHRLPKFTSFLAKLVKRLSNQELMTLMQLEDHRHRTFFHRLVPHIDSLALVLEILAGCLPVNERAALIYWQDELGLTPFHESKKNIKSFLLMHLFCSQMSTFFCSEPDDPKPSLLMHAVQKHEVFLILCNHFVEKGLLTSHLISNLLFYYVLNEPAQLKMFLTFLQPTHAIQAVAHQDDEGKNLFHHAASQPESMAVLLESEAFHALMFVPDHHGKTPFHEAIEHEHVLALLCKRLPKPILQRGMELDGVVILDAVLRRRRACESLFLRYRDCDASQSMHVKAWYDVLAVMTDYISSDCFSSFDSPLQQMRFCYSMYLLTEKYLTDMNERTHADFILSIQSALDDTIELLMLPKLMRLFRHQYELRLAEPEASSLIDDVGSPDDAFSSAALIQQFLSTLPTEALPEPLEPVSGTTYQHLFLSGANGKFHQDLANMKPH